MTLLTLIVLSQVAVYNNGTRTHPQASRLDLNGSISCTRAGPQVNCSVSGGAGGSGAPVDGGYVVLSTAGSTNERTLSAGNYTTIDTATPGQVQVDWAHGLTCSAGNVLTTGSTSTLTCVSNVATATALAADPTDCGGGQYATAIAANGNLTCSTPPGTGTRYMVTGADVSNSTTTPATITGLSWTATNGVAFGFFCSIVAAGTATSGPRYNISGPSVTTAVFETRRFTSTSAQALLVLQSFSGAVQTAACTASCNTTNLPTFIAGSALPSATGTVNVQLTSSTAGQTVTVRRGSYCIVY